MSIHELATLNEMGGDVGVLERWGVWAGVESGVAGLGPANACSAPCHGQQLRSAFCFCPGPLQEGFCVRTVYELWPAGQWESLDYRHACKCFLIRISGLYRALGFV